MDNNKLNEIEKLLKEYKVKKLTKVNDESQRFFNIETYKVDIDENRYMYRDKLTKGNFKGSACVIVPFIDEENVLMVVQPRAFLKEGAMLDFPGGYVDADDENFVEAAIRELEEETGYTSNNLKEIASYYYDEGLGNAIVHLYVAKNLVKVGELELDEDEFLEPVIVNFNDLDELISKRYVYSGVAQFANEKIKLQRLKEKYND